MSLYNLSPIGNGVQFLDINGSPLIGGQLRSYVAGSSTPQATYTGPTGAISNGTIIILGVDGRAPNEIWIPSGVAIKFQLLDSSLTLIHTWDNIVGVNDFTTSAAQSGEWLPTGLVPNYYSTTQFAVSGNQLATFQVNRRIQAQVGAGLVYGTITSSVYSVATTVTLAMDAGMALDVGLVSVNVALLSGTHPSVPVPVTLATTATNALTANNVVYGGNGVPPGAVMPFAMNGSPTGWLACDGSAVSRTTYAALFAVLSTVYGTGDGSTTFNLPDLRGYFVRGYGTNSDGTASAAFGTKQADALKSHTHSYNVGASGLAQGGSRDQGITTPPAGSTTGATGDTETRPKNIAMLYCIKT